jgi:hypothetical protein
MKDDTGELVSVLVVAQASFMLVAALIALPFGIVEPGYRVLGLVTMAVSVLMFWSASRLRRNRQWARRTIMTLELLSLLASILLMLLPIGAMRGPVPLIVNLVLPATVLWLLWSRRAAFRAAASDARHAA